MNEINERWSEGFTRAELAFFCILSIAVSIRQVAMTMVMPFISVYSQSLDGYTPTLAGMALGVFGLTQAVFQIPFGLWSDKIGNKKVILIGFAQVIAGLVIAYFATDIYWLILARALQGSGAVIAVVFSWVSAGLNERLRLKAMSIVSASIGFAAAASFAFGPLVHHVMTVNEMFLVCACIIAVSWLLILLYLQEPQSRGESKGAEIGAGPEEATPAGFKPLLARLMRNSAYLKLNAAAFVNNYVMLSVFYIVPMNLQTITGTDGMWKVFMPAVILAIIALKCSARAAAKGYRYLLLQVAFLLGAAGIALFYESSYGFILAGSVLFMICYISVSTIAQSCVNDMADAGYRGTVNGIFNSIQYLGSFIGSLVTGFAWEINPRLALGITLAAAGLGVAVMRGTYGTKLGRFKDLPVGGKAESKSGR